MGKIKNQTPERREIHNRAVKIRKMPDEKLVELERQAMAAKLTKERAAVEQQPEKIINRVADLLNELENGAVPGIGVALKKRIREFAQSKQYI